MLTSLLDRPFFLAFSQFGGAKLKKEMLPHLGFETAFIYRSLRVCLLFLLSCQLSRNRKGRTVGTEMSSYDHYTSQK